MSSILSIVLWALAAILIAVLFIIAYNHLPISEKDDSIERIVFVPGIKTDPIFLSGWKLYLTYHFPNIERVFIEGNYHYKNIESVTDIQDRLLEVLKEEKRTVVIAHSYGGIQIVAAMQSGEIDTSFVHKIVGLAPALDPVFKGLSESREVIGFSQDPIDTPMSTFCGIFDTTVPCKSTSFPGAEYVEKTLNSHVTFQLPQVFYGRTIIKELR